MNVSISRRERKHKNFESGSAKSDNDSNSSSRGNSRRRNKTKQKTAFDPQNNQHTKMLQGSVSDDENTNLTNSDSLKSKRRKSAKFDLPSPPKSIIIFGDDDDIDSDDIDEKGNIKDLIDYNDEKDYAEYQREMKAREGKIKTMLNKHPIVFSKNENKNSDESSDSEKDEESDNDDTSEAMKLLIPFFMGEQNSNPLAELQARVMASNIPINCKESVLKRLENADPDKPKLIEWIESLLNIPFGRFTIMPVNINDPREKIKSFFDEVIKNFELKVYGLRDVKQQIIDYLAQFIASGSDSNSSPRPLALYGEAGIGKTFIIRHGIADVLGRPLCCVNMGGIKDSAHMCGFEYSYSNARYGTLIQKLIEKQVMDPIINFEEVDKISETRDGNDIQNVLMHLTDPEQNTSFQDKYFSGIDIDFSKALLVFTMNDPSRLNPILLNRLHLIKVPNPSREDKIEIAKRYILPELLKKINMSSDLIIIRNEIYNYILDHYCQGDKGLRTLKHCIETIILRINTVKLIGSDLSGKLQFTFPLLVDSELVDKILHQSQEQNSALNSMFG